MKALHSFLLFFSIFLSTQILLAQEPIPRDLREQTNGLEHIIPFTGSGVAFASESYNHWMQYIDNERTTSRNRNSLERSIFKKHRYNTKDQYLFQIVFHNLTDLPEEKFRVQVVFQLEALNRDFTTRTNHNPNDYYYSYRETPNFKFRLAENGVVATERPVEWKHFNYVKDDRAGGSPPIHPSKYINVWVVDIPDSIGSYAQSPMGPNASDGIVVDIDFFGSGKIPYHLGRTMTHLMGAYFGLHPLYNIGLCAEDGVYDTPVHHQPMRNCFDTNIRSSCDGRPLMTANFMSLAPDLCKYYFTKDQVRRMVNMVTHAEDRRSLFTLTTSGE